MNPPLAITLVPFHRPTFVVSAGWLASADPVEWLREVAHGRRHGCELAIYPVAASQADPRAVGVFLMPVKGSPAFRPRVMPLVEVETGVHAPHDAGLSAGLLPNERSYFFPYPLHFFHPSHGVIGFEPKDQLSPAALLTARARPAAEWTWAIPAPENFPLVSIVVALSNDGPEEMLKEAGQDIGDKSGSSSPGDSGLGGKLGQLGAGLAGGGLLGLGWLLSKLPWAGIFPLFRIAGSGRPGKSVSADGAGKGADSDLIEWAKKHWSQLLDKRQREIERLMDLMEKNPDEGLRYALPLAGSEQSRGKAPPSWKLGARNLDFRSGGGHAADGWDLDADARLKLERKYREAAQREIELGRYERAAYILGNLLGDWNSAAKALSAAGRHHDAVSIYLHKMNNRAAAARSLEEAGLLAQAAEMYLSIKNFEKAGDLHARLANDAEARRLWFLAVEAQGDGFEKARIYQTKLKESSAAMAVLQGLWLAGNQPALAVERMFSILREYDQAQGSIDLLNRMFDESPPSLSLSERIRIALDESEHRPKEPDFRVAAEKQIYQRIGDAVVGGSSGSLQLLEFLPRLDRGDRLLERDAKRYAIPKTKIEVTETHRTKGVLRPSKVVKIPLTASWQSISPLKVGLSVAGHANGILAVAQLRENGCHASPLMTSNVLTGRDRVTHLGVVSTRGHSRLFHFPASQNLHYRSLDRSRTPQDDEIGNLANILSIGPFGVADEFLLLEHTATGSLSAHVYGESAALRRTIPLDLAPSSVDQLTWYCAGRGGHLCFTAEGFFAWRHPDGRFETIGMDDFPRGLHISPQGDAPSILLPRLREIVLIEPGKPGKPLEAVNLYADERSESSPVACFTKDGHIVVGHESGGAIYAPGSYLDPVQTLAFPSDVGHPIDACAFGVSGFAFLTSEGQLVVFS